MTRGKRGVIGEKNKVKKKQRKAELRRPFSLSLFGVGSGVLGGGTGVSVLHLGVGSALGGLLGLSSLASLLLSGSFGSLLGLDALLDGLALGLDLFKVALDDGAGHGADLVHLGDVDALGGVLALIVQPVLGLVSSWYTKLGGL